MTPFLHPPSPVRNASRTPRSSRRNASRTIGSSSLFNARPVSISTRASSQSRITRSSPHAAASPTSRSKASLGANSPARYSCTEANMSTSRRILWLLSDVISGTPYLSSTQLVKEGQPPISWSSGRRTLRVESSCRGFDSRAAQALIHPAMRKKQNENRSLTVVARLTTATTTTSTIRDSRVFHSFASERAPLRGVLRRRPNPIGAQAPTRATQFTDESARVQRTDAGASYTCGLVRRVMGLFW
jgi:hypothetical protein